MNIRTQDEIVADLVARAENLEHSARTARHSKANRLALQLAARVLRVAAEQNSRLAVADRTHVLTIHEGGKQ